jgi:hypothetical protein
LSLRHRYVVYLDRHSPSPRTRRRGVASVDHRVELLELSIVTPSGRPAGLADCTRWQVSWLADPCLAPTFPADPEGSSSGPDLAVPSGVRPSAYSCGGSRGFDALEASHRIPYYPRGYGEPSLRFLEDRIPAGQGGRDSGGGSRFSR